MSSESSAKRTRVLPSSCEVLVFEDALFGLPMTVVPRETNVKAGSTVRRTHRDRAPTTAPNAGSSAGRCTPLCKRGNRPGGPPLRWESGRSRVVVRDRKAARSWRTDRLSVHKAMFPSPVIQGRRRERYLGFIPLASFCRGETCLARPSNMGRHRYSDVNRRTPK